MFEVIAKNAFEIGPYFATCNFSVPARQDFVHFARLT
jgi:hypothetical protein